MFSSAATQAAGVQPKVAPTWLVACAITRSLPSVPPIGITPPAKPLASRISSGSRSQRSTANICAATPDPRLHLVGDQHPAVALAQAR